MTVSKVCYFATLFLIVWSASYCNANCKTPEGEILEEEEYHVVNCEDLYLCDYDSNLDVYPACFKMGCENATKHRDLDTSKPWPECCPRYTC